MVPEESAVPAIKVFTMKQLQEATGAPSTTIHYYLRHGLLPRPQKTSASRSLYTEEHVTILQKIAECKQAGLSLLEIEDEVRSMVDRANSSKIDVVGQEWERMRNRILSVAAKEFISVGYKNTYVTTIIRSLRITPNLLYSYFSGKRALLLACVTALMNWSLKYVDAKQAGTTDPGERLLWLVFGHANVFRVGSSALALVRIEGAENDRELRKPLQTMFDNIIGYYVKEVRASAQGFEARATAVPDELLAHSLFGAYEQTMFRVQADAKYTREDALRTHLWLFLAVQAAKRGEIDVDSRLKPYADLLAELGNSMPPLPPELQN
jgi:DNA-binding transcriptional MerR regulator